MIKRRIPKSALVIAAFVTLSASYSGTPLTQAALVAQSWQQIAKLTASDGGAGVRFGDSIALSADGSTLIVGADHAGGDLQYGAAYVFSRSGSAWTEQHKIAAPVGTLPGAHLGAAVALSPDGNTAMIGEPGGQGFGTVTAVGLVDVETRSGTAWTPIGELLAPNPAPGNEFGSPLALSSDSNTAVVSSGNYPKGSTYVVTRGTTSWGGLSTTYSEQTAGDLSDNDFYGFGVALSGDGHTVLTGAAGKNSGAGAAYALTGGGSSWTQQQELAPADPASASSFGWSDALSSDGNTALIGAWGKRGDTGAAYVFTRGGATWSQQKELTASDGTARDKFGISAALSGDGTTALVGAPPPTNAPRPGAAYVFAGSGSSWTQQSKLRAGDGSQGDLFGTSAAVSADGSTLVVGAPGKNDMQGAVYVFARGAGSAGSGGSPTSVGVAPGSSGGVAAAPPAGDSSGSGALLIAAVVVAGAIAVGGWLLLAARRRRREQSGPAP